MASSRCLCQVECDWLTAQRAISDLRSAAQFILYPTSSDRVQRDSSIASMNEAITSIQRSLGTLERHSNLVAQLTVDPSIPVPPLPRIETGSQFAEQNPPAFLQLPDEIKKHNDLNSWMRQAMPLLEVFMYLPSPVTSIYHVCFTSKTLKPFAHDCFCSKNRVVVRSPPLAQNASGAPVMNVLLRMNGLRPDELTVLAPHESLATSLPAEHSSNPSPPNILLVSAYQTFQKIGRFLKNTFLLESFNSAASTPEERLREDWASFLKLMRTLESYAGLFSEACARCGRVLDARAPPQPPLLRLARRAASSPSSNEPRYLALHESCIAT